jgi:hypothetical protein
LRQSLIGGFGCSCEAKSGGGLIIPASPPNLPGGMVHRLCRPQVGASVEKKQVATANPSRWRTGLTV